MSDEAELDAPPRETRVRAPRRRGDLVRTVSRGIGQTLMTFGLVALLFVVYELWATDLLAARAQDQLTQQIEEQWADEPPTTVPPADAPTVVAPESAPAPAPGPAAESVRVDVGEPFAVLHVPALGNDYSRVIVEGTAQDQLDQGPGHYIDTAMPGQQGNFAVAGHRVGRGSPFVDLDRLRPGDAIVVETGSDWFTYRVLGDQATGDFGSDPSGIPGQQIVSPGDVDVIAPTPGGPTTAAPSDAYLTLTTCHPKYSAEQRLVVHARLDGAPLSKAAAPGGPPALDS
ncbi:sortase A [Blastococcus aurantiacus]|uniref:Sortase A n=1 Tax=Blastococcus aurantiacus TaxID=1550231 RepID=A0A1G7QE39_9ACTN|nr:class E sortase [Blastococcus aurantiacus]SDF96748.1 sortase A [Blastococcus aurantiacus]